MKNLQPPTSNLQSSGLAAGLRPWMLAVPKFSLLLVLRAYKIFVSPLLTFLCGPVGGCRFTPTCSVYAAEAIRAHGALTGSALAAKRLCRCHPWGDCGHDPVPKSDFKFQVSGFKF